MLAFVTMHMVAHVALLVSFEWADAALAFLMAPWRTMPGTVLARRGVPGALRQRAVVDLSAALACACRAGSWWQLVLGLCHSVPADRFT